MGSPLSADGRPPTVDRRLPTTDNPRMASLLLKPGREKALLRRHPWVFAGAVAQVKGRPAAGETVAVLTAQGRFLAQAAYSPRSQIRARVWTFREDEVIGPDWFRRRLEQARKRREGLIGPDTTAYRMVFGESDGLPGLIVDRYEDTLVVQFLSAGAEYWRETLVDLLAAWPEVRHIYERSDTEARRLEGLEPRTGPLHGHPPERVRYRENGLTFVADIFRGHKTGAYLDQRENRKVVRTLARGRRVLDVFAYTGGFTVHALAGGAASVVAVDASDEALRLARENVAGNGFDPHGVAWVQGNAFEVLREMVREGRTFDLVVLDPPKFAFRADQVPRAARGYKDINRLGFLLLNPGGYLVTFSCSGHVEAGLFQKIVADAALDAGRWGQVVRRLFQGPDHPVALPYPEAAYLKGLVVRVGGTK